MVATTTRRRISAILSTVISEEAQRVSHIEALLSHERIDLADRLVDGISVVLYWTRATNVVTVAVDDSTTGDYFELVLDDDERPLDVFYHPYAYARARGLELNDDVKSTEVALDALDA
jgi:hypothetical protein